MAHLFLGILAQNHVCSVNCTKSPCRTDKKATLRHPDMRLSRPRVHGMFRLTSRAFAEKSDALPGKLARAFR